MSDYLNFFPKPLLEDMVKGECLPIIGSGFSLNAEMPKNVTMPLWKDLGKKFAAYLKGFDSADNALEAISAYSHNFSRNNMVSKLRTFLNIDQISPGKTHKLFAEIPFKIVCTTNFDNLLENSYSICRPVVIVEESQLSISYDDRIPLILKLHGDLGHPSRLVVTEDDYDLFVEKNPLLTTYLSYLLIVKTPLFIGYSIDDPDFRQIFKIVGERLGPSKRPAYAITVNAKSEEIAKYERRGVKVINITNPGSSYSKVFPDLFKELKQYLNNNVLENGSSIQSDSEKHLLHEENLQNRLCYFSLANKDLPLYKQLVFPLLEKYGLIPLSPDEFLTPGDLIVAKINAMIDKAQVIICDISTKSNFVMWELGVSMSYKNKKKIVIGNEIDCNSFICNRNDVEYITRGNDLMFIEELDRRLKSISQPLYETFAEEPDRLLKKNEPKAAFISAFSLLEIELNHYFEKEKTSHDPLVSPIGELIEKLRRLKVLNDEQVLNLQNWRRIRNNVIHTKEGKSEQISDEMVHGIMEIVKFIRDASKRNIN